MLGSLAGRSGQGIADGGPIWERKEAVTTSLIRIMPSPVHARVISMVEAVQPRMWDCVKRDAATGRGSLCRLWESMSMFLQAIYEYFDTYGMHVEMVCMTLAGNWQTGLRTAAGDKES